MNKEITAAELKEKAKQLRKTAVTMIYEAQSGHPGGSLSIADIVACLYFREMNVDPKDPRWADRDRFVLSKGHVCPIQYSALGLLGFFPEAVSYTHLDVYKRQSLCLWSEAPDWGKHGAAAAPGPLWC